MPSDLKICKELFPEEEYGLPMSAEEKRAAFPVRLIDIPERQVAYIRVMNAFRSQDLQRTLPGRGIWSPHERGRKESRFSSEIDRHSRKASRLYSGYECLPISRFAKNSSRKRNMVSP